MIERLVNQLLIPHWDSQTIQNLKSEISFMPADVFISYSSNDQDKVVKLADKLRSSGVSIWVDESGIGAATLWSKEIAGAIKGCKVLVLMVTPNSVTSKNVVKEVSLAAEQNKQILPVILEPTQIPEALEYHLAGIQHLDVGGMSATESAEEILPAVLRLLGMEGEEAIAVGHGIRSSRRRSARVWTAWQLYACVIVAAALGWLLKPTPPILEAPAPPESRHVEVVLQGTNDLNKVFGGNAFALSLDGKNLVYSMIGAGSNLRILSLADGVDREILGTEGGRNPFFSPDGQSVGFSTSDELKTISLMGGKSSSLIASLDQGGRGAAWGPDKIAYTPALSSGLMIIDSNGGAPKPLTELNTNESTHRWPQWLPDRKHVIFMVGRVGNLAAINGQIEVVNVASGNRTLLKEGCTYGRYVSSGHLLYAVDDSLYAQEIDLEKMELKGKQTLVLQGLEANFGGTLQYAMSDDGTLIYSTGGDEGNRRFLWIDMQGETELASAKKGNFDWFDISPDDNMVALGMDNNIHFLDLETDFLRAFTPIGGNKTNSIPRWTADGQSILFASNKGGKIGIWQKKADFTDEAKLLYPEVDYELFPYSFSSDGKILFGGAIRPETRYDVWVHTLGKTNSELRFVLESSSNETWPALSPDGQWLVYSSDLDLYVKHYSGEGAVQRMTTDGGYKARWSNNGDKIFYENQGAIWSISMAVEGDAIKPGMPTLVVDFPPSHVVFRWDISSDEKRFLVYVEDVNRNSVNIIFNWFTELNRLVPAGKE